MGKMSVKDNKHMMEILSAFAEYANYQIGVDFDTQLEENEMDLDTLMADFLKGDKIQKMISNVTAEKKGKKAKDPNAPKRNMSAYFFYQQDVREKTAKKNPEAKAKDLTSIMAAQWNKLSDKDKKPYVEKAEKDKDRYLKEYEEYEPSEGFTKKKSKKDGPKKPLSGYMMYCNEHRAQVKEDNPEFKTTEITTELGRMWKEDIDQDERDEWNSKAKKIADKMKAVKKEDEEDVEVEEEDAEEEHEEEQEEEEEPEEEEEEEEEKSKKKPSKKEDKKKDDKKKDDKKKDAKKDDKKKDDKKKDAKKDEKKKKAKPVVDDEELLDEE